MTPPRPEITEAGLLPTHRRQIIELLGRNVTEPFALNLYLEPGAPVLHMDERVQFPSAPLSRELTNGAIRAPALKLFIIDKLVNDLPTTITTAGPPVLDREHESLALPKPFVTPLIVVPSQLLGVPIKSLSTLSIKPSRQLPSHAFPPL